MYCFLIQDTSNSGLSHIISNFHSVVVLDHLQKIRNRTGEMTQWEEMPATTTEDLSSVPALTRWKTRVDTHNLSCDHHREDSLLESFLFFHHVSLGNELRAPGWVADVFFCLCHFSRPATVCLLAIKRNLAWEFHNRYEERRIRCGQATLSSIVRDKTLQKKRILQMSPSLGEHLC